MVKWILCFLVIGRAMAATFYVAPSGGDDNGPGTYAQPFATGAKAVSLVQPGDTVIFKDGTYTMTLGSGPSGNVPFINLINKHGTSVAPITFKPETFRGVTFQGFGNISSATRKAVLRAQNCSWLVIEGFRVVDCDTTGIWLDGTNDSIVRSNVVRRINWTLGGVGIAMGGSYTLNNSERNLVEDNVILQFHRHGIALQHGYGNRNTIRGNYGNDMGWRANGNANTTSRLAEFVVCYGTEENLIENNVAHNVFGHAVSIHGSNRGSGNRVLGCIGINAANPTFFANSREATSPERAFITNAWFENCVAITNLQASGFTLQHGSNIVVTNCFSTRSYRGYHVTQNDFFWNDSVSHSDIWDANLQFKNFSSYINNSVALDNLTAGIELSWENTAAGYEYEGTHRAWLTSNTSDGHGSNNLKQESSPYVVLVSNTGFSTANPGYDTATYGNGAYLMRAPNAPTRGAEVLYRYQDGVLTSTPLWPWKMESVVTAETDYSVTWEDDGAGNTRGLWKTLDGVYEATPTEGPYIKIYFAPQDEGATRLLREGGPHLDLIVTRSATDSTAEAITGNWEWSGELLKDVHFTFSGNTNTWAIDAGQIQAVYELDDIPDGVRTGPMDGYITVTTGSGYDPTGVPAHFLWVDAQGDPAFSRGPHRPGQYQSPSRFP